MQLLRVELELGVRLQNYVILIQLRVKSIDLALAKRVVERVVDGGRRDTEPRGRGTVNGHRCRQTT